MLLQDHIYSLLTTPSSTGGTKVVGSMYNRGRRGRTGVGILLLKKSSEQAEDLKKDNPSPVMSETEASTSRAKSTLLEKEPKETEKAETPVAISETVKAATVSPGVMSDINSSDSVVKTGLPPVHLLRSPPIPKKRPHDNSSTVKSKPSKKRVKYSKHSDIFT